MPGTLRRIDQPPGGRLIPAVPLRAGGDHLDITMRVIEPGSVALDPYPFADSNFEVQVPSRWIEDRRYGTPEESADACRAATPATITIAVRES